MEEDWLRDFRDESRSSCGPLSYFIDAVVHGRILSALEKMKEIRFTSKFGNILFKKAFPLIKRASEEKAPLIAVFLFLSFLNLIWKGSSVCFGIASSLSSS